MQYILNIMWWETSITAHSNDINRTCNVCKQHARSVLTIIYNMSMTMWEDTGVIGSDVPWLECPACNALTWVITVTE